jgi:hypothetical protein
MGIKSAVKEWMSEKWDQWVKQPIADKTQQLETSAATQINKYSNKAKEQAYKPVEYYWKQDAFYRGLFWIAVMCLVMLWIISGS